MIVSLQGDGSFDGSILIRSKLENNSVATFFACKQGLCNSIFNMLVLVTSSYNWLTVYICRFL